MATATATSRRKKNHNRRLNAWEKRLTNRVVFCLALVNMTILGVSLEHLASGIIEISGSPAWSGWAMAVAIDLGMVASEVATIALGVAVPGVVAYAHRYVVATIFASMVLNIMGFWPAETNIVGASLAIFLGCGIPAAVWHLTRISGELWMRANYKKDKR